MTYKEYNDIRTDIAVENQCSKFLGYLDEIMDIYPILKNETLSDVRQYIEQQRDKFNRNVIRKIGVFEPETNEYTVEYDGVWNVTVKCDNTSDKTVMTFKKHE